MYKNPIENGSDMSIKVKTMKLLEEDIETLQNTVVSKDIWGKDQKCWQRKQKPIQGVTAKK